MAAKPGGSGSCPHPVQQTLRWNVDVATADNIGCNNRHYAEYSGYWLGTGLLTEFPVTAAAGGVEIKFYDSVTGKLLFVAPRGRTYQQFIDESTHHGWPSFNDQETVKENVRVLSDGETVSVDGTHLGHNLPDTPGVNRYCIDLVSIAGFPQAAPSATTTAAAAAPSCAPMVGVYFGNGCFWHTQCVAGRSQLRRCSRRRWLRGRGGFLVRAPT